jgi:hypothetical protein
MIKRFLKIYAGAFLLGIPLAYICMAWGFFLDVLSKHKYEHVKGFWGASLNAFFSVDVLINVLKVDAVLALFMALILGVFLRR